MDENQFRSSHPHKDLPKFSICNHFILLKLPLYFHEGAQISPKTLKLETQVLFH